jgi:inhibitor of cysteine peptidase
MKHILFSPIIILVFISACTPATYQSSATVGPSVTSLPGDSIPTPANSNLIRGNAYLDSTDLLTMESYPLQFAIMLKGNLPTPCHTLQVEVSPPDSQNNIFVDVYSITDPNALCMQVLKPFEEYFPLGSFPSGHYTLWINGKQISEFDV